MRIPCCVSNYFQRIFYAIAKRNNSKRRESKQHRLGSFAQSNNTLATGPTKTHKAYFNTGEMCVCALVIGSICIEWGEWQANGSLNVLAIVLIRMVNEWQRVNKHDWFMRERVYWPETLFICDVNPVVCVFVV